MTSCELRRSMLHWCLRSMSRPKMKSICCSFSRTVIAHGRCAPPTVMGAWCTLPMIFCVPTPTAWPSKRLSTSRIRPHRSAIGTFMMLICAPLSMNALIGTPFTSMLMYNMSTCTNASGIVSYAKSADSWMFFSWMSSSMRRCASTSNGSAFRRSAMRCISISRSASLRFPSISTRATPAASLFITAWCSDGLDSLSCWREYGSDLSCCMMVEACCSIAFACC
mmetsp:Transcript_22447/g.72878  ORF Transcript_22447/g.72878 Transcript_22447/m.72878 type:complete len:223 (-) Transcript_22447:266-934(-)